MKRSKKLSGLDKYVIFSIVLLIAFTVVEFLMPITHDTLTTCFFACFGGEILSCALIKIFKLKGDKQDE